MLFGTPLFLTVFLPAAVLAHAALQALSSAAARRRGGGAEPSAWPANLLLVLLGALFCFLGDSRGLAVLLGSAVLNDLAARLVAALRAPRARRAALAAAVGANVAALAWFKYAGFLAEIANSALGAAIPVPKVLLPLGVSFYTFRAIAYQVDVARGVHPPARSPLDFLCYMLLFPVLVSGPIVRFREIAPQLRSRPFSAELAASGFRRFFVGLAKKVLVADAVAPLADAVWGVAGGGLGVAPSMAWLGLAAYSVQLYFDFSGYSDMAIGVGRMLGFRIGENFDHPYAAASIREFWRRWHVSLSSWLRDYLYIPLGGSRRGAARACLNSIVVFAVCGVWHGAGWTFLLWGLWHGALVVAERLLPDAPRPRSAAGRAAVAAARHAYALLAVALGWALFRSPDLATARTLLLSLAGAVPAAPAAAALWIDATPPCLAALAAGAVLSLPVVPALRRLARRALPEPAAWAAESLWATLLGLAAALFVAGGTHQAFLYFKF